MKKIVQSIFKKDTLESVPPSNDSFFNKMLDKTLSVFSNNSGSLILVTCVIASVPPLYYLYKFRKDIKKRLQDIETRSNFKVVREKNGDNKRRIRCLELSPEFVEENKEKWQLMSFGQYLSQLRPVGDDYKFFEKELEVTIGKLILKSLGKAIGSVMLPILGTSSAELVLSKFSSNLAGYFAKHILTDEQSADVTTDAAVVNITLSELMAAININQKNISSGVSDVTALDLFRMGEAGYGDLSFHNEEKYVNGLGYPNRNGFPSPFVMEHDYETFITDMEEEYRKIDPKYESDDKSYPPSTPINERILPDLYLGPGDAKCTHTKKESIENRFFSFLLNRLSYNYYKKVNGDVDLFEVHWNNKKCRFPDDLIQACLDNGHKVEVCPAVTVAAFGAHLCVKEEDGSFTNIPICCQMHSGVERSSDASAAYVIAPHGGLELNITGPLIGKSNTCASQYYIALTGVACWFANEDLDLPHLHRRPLCKMYSDSEAVTAVRMAGLTSHVYNSVGADLNLPFGGYGVMGVCNDTTAILDYAVRGETSVYPIVASGRYLNHIFDRFLALKAGLENDPEMKKVMKDVETLIKASIDMPNDLNIYPSTICDTARRMCASNKTCTFQMTKDSKAIFMEMAEKRKNYD